MADDTIMAEHTTNTTAPAQVTTTISQPSHPQQALADKTFTGTDVVWLLGAVVLVLGLYTAIRKLFKDKKAEETAEANARMTTLKDAIQESKDDAARDLKIFADKFTETKSLFDKDIDAIKTDHRHYKANREQVDSAVTRLIERNSDDLKLLNNRMTTQEEKSRSTEAAIARVEQLLKDQSHETRELLKDQTTRFENQIRLMSEKEEGHFNQICETLREMSKRETK